MNAPRIKINPLRACLVAWVTAVVAAFACGCVYAVFLEQRHSSEFLLAVSKGSPNALQVLLYVGAASAAVAAIVAAILIALLALPLIGLATKKSSAYTAAAFCVVFVLVVLLNALNYFVQVLPGSDIYFAIISTLVSGLVALMVFRIVVSKRV